MKMEEFTTQVKDILSEHLVGALEQHKTDVANEITAQLDTQIKALVTDGIEKSRPSVVVGEDRLAEDPKGGFLNISDFAHKVYLAEKSNGRSVPKELVDWEKAVKKTASATSMVEGDSEYGGFLIPPEFKNDLWLAVEQDNPLMDRIMKIPMKSTTVNIPFINGFDESGNLVYGGIRWYWLDELATKTETRPKIGRVTLTLHKCAGLAYTSDEILEDSPISMENLLKKGFEDGLKYEMNRMIVRGNGGGQPLGITNAPCLVSITKETGQAADTITYENIIKMYARIADPAADLVWIANSNTLPQLCTMALSVGTGGIPVFMPANGAAGVPYDTLMGKPIIFNKQCSSVGTVGDIMLCDMSQYLLGQKAGQGATGKFDTSIHLKFDSDQTAFRFVFRVDGKPWWLTALTPPVATSDTISPFVAIASRD